MNNVQAKLIEEIEEQESKINDWERDFIDNLTKYYVERNLSDTQNKCLNRIHHSVVFSR